MAHSTRDVIQNTLKRCAIKRAAKGTSFTLSSGETSDIYCDVKPVILDSSCFRDVAYLLHDTINKNFESVNTLAGVVLGGCHLASITSMYVLMRFRHNWDVAFVRKQSKDHGTQKLIEQSRAIDASLARIVLLEDVITTGNSVVAAADQLVSNQLNVIGIVSLVDRRQEKAETLDNRYPIRSIFTLDELL